MQSRRWVNNTQPQTLQIAVFLLYINAFFELLGRGFVVPLGLALIAGQVGAGYGIANERKWGYGLGVVMALIPLALHLLPGGLLGSTTNLATLMTLMFEIALVALLLHPQSREYQRIWFR
ncbi:MAG: hypothetical protein E6G27_03755 [Actinobacteria bacterium]|nr:MAG: hypothetical protein E6G27_03755 [Actinomycetota bacterium]